MDDIVCYCEGPEICDNCLHLIDNPEMAYDSPDDFVTVYVELPVDIEVSPSVLEIVVDLEQERSEQ